VSSQETKLETETYRFPAPHCLNERDVVDYVSRTRQGEVDEAVRDHLIACSRCRLLVQQALLGEAMASTPAPQSTSAHKPLFSWRGARLLVAAAIFVVVSLVVAMWGISRPEPSAKFAEEMVEPDRAGGPAEERLAVSPGQIEQPQQPLTASGATEAADGTTIGSRRRVSEHHGINSVLVIEIADFPHVVNGACESCLAKLRTAERKRLDDWIGSEATVKKMTGKDAFMLLTPEHREILVFLFDREVIERIADRHRIFASIGRAIDTDGDGEAWDDAQSLSDFAGLFGGLPGFTSLSNMGDTERLQYVLESVDVPILIVHSREHAELAKAEANNSSSIGLHGSPKNFIE